jgi:phosphatidylserine/phosphatidylglycerophosphate/cardiolipin synthase-like enzyme
MKRVLFPSIKLTSDGDIWIRKVMKKIDQAKDYAWILTYAFDSSYTANLVLKKMISAQKRGVNCVLYVDDLQ